MALDFTSGDLMSSVRAAIADLTPDLRAAAVSSSGARGEVAVASDQRPVQGVVERVATRESNLAAIALAGASMVLFARAVPNVHEQQRDQLRLAEDAWADSEWDSGEWDDARWERGR